MARLSQTAGITAPVTIIVPAFNEAESIAETLEIAGTEGIEILAATVGDDARLRLVDESADIVLMARDAINAGLDERLSRPERIRHWTYEFDPAGLEILRRAIDHAATERRRGAHPGLA